MQLAPCSYASPTARSAKTGLIGWARALQQLQIATSSMCFSPCRLLVAAVYCQSITPYRRSLQRPRNLPSFYFLVLLLSFLRCLGLLFPALLFLSVSVAPSSPVDHTTTTEYHLHYCSAFLQQVNPLYRAVEKQTYDASFLES